MAAASRPARVRLGRVPAVYAGVYTGDMKFRTLSHAQIEANPLPGPSAVVCMADSQADLAVIKDAAHVVARLNLIFNDATESFQQVRPPTPDDALKILQFVHDQSHVPHLVLQCRVGIGRSQAVHAAILKIQGLDPGPVLRGGTYNRRLYRLVLTAAGVPPGPEPLVSMAVRVKYAPDRLQLLLLSMQRQRYENWEVVAVTDGPNPAAAQLVSAMQDPRIRLIETEKPLGRWGHPYRQRGLDACRGEFIGMSNDDNYYVPGYLEQMLYALQDADFAMCPFLHSYYAWRAVHAGLDLGSWIARAFLVRQTPWPGDDFSSDQAYIRLLTELAKDRTAILEHPLFVHN